MVTEMSKCLNDAKRKERDVIEKTSELVTKFEREGKGRGAMDGGGRKRR